jgi:DNA-binding transcriptional MerR regulator
MDCEELLEPSEVGRMLILSSARVSQLAREGRLTVAARTRRGRRLFRREDVENYLRTIQRQRAERE